MKKRYFLLLLLTFFLLNCKKENPKNTPVIVNDSDKNFVDFAIKVNGMGKREMEGLFNNIDSISNGNESDKKLYKAYSDVYHSPKDSLKYYINKVDLSNRSVEVREFFDLLKIRTDIPEAGVIDIKTTEKVLAKINETEKRKSPFTYRYYEVMANVLFNNGDIKKSKEYFDLAYKNDPNKNTYAKKILFYQVGNVYASQMGDFKSMQINQNEIEKLSLEKKDTLNLARAYDYKAIYYGMQNKKDSALYYSLKSFKLLETKKALNPAAYGNLGKNYLLAGDADNAIKYAREGAQETLKVADSSYLANNYSLLSNAYELKKDYDSALYYRDEYYIALMDGKEKAEGERIADLEKKYETAKKDLTIKSLNSKNSLNLETIKQQRWMLFSLGLLAVSGGLLFYNRHKRNLLKEKTERLSLENEKLKLEQKTLQLKLNPHFIYNSVSNLQGLISQNKNEESISYLNKFARIMKSVLEYDQEDFIPLKEEISLLKDYLQLQQMRYNYNFDYKIDVEPEIDEDLLMIPPMLLQPLVENSILHGFKNIDYKGFIEISFEENQENTVIKINDNGIGNQAHLKNPGDKAPHSTNIIAERLHILFKGKKSRIKRLGSEKGYAVVIEYPTIKDI